jgi:hypothetical protein
LSNFDYFLFEWYHSVLFRGFIFENASQRKAKKVQQSARIKIVWIKWYSSLIFKELIFKKGKLKKSQKVAAFCSYKICLNLDYFSFEWYHSAKFMELTFESWRKCQKAASICFFEICLILLLRLYYFVILKELFSEKPKCCGILFISNLSEFWLCFCSNDILWVFFWKLVG